MMMRNELGRNETIAKVLALAVAVASILLIWVAGHAQSLPVAAPKASEADPATKRQAVQMLQSSPAPFVENRGQWADASIHFALSSRGVNVGLTSQGLHFQLFKHQQSAAAAEAPREKDSLRKRIRGNLNPQAESPTSSVATRMKEFTVRFEGARSVAPVGRDHSGQLFHFRRGDPARWRERVPAWTSVVYPGLYEGIDLVITGRQGGLKYEFHVAPGADWKRIRFHYEDIEKLSLGQDTPLSILPGEGWEALTDGAPLIFQGAGDSRKLVPGRFKLMGPCTLAFELTGPYDSSRPLVIDPDLAWSTYLGGSGEDSANGIALDAAGNIYLAGTTSSSGWISAGLDASFNGGESDAYVTKLSSAGKPLWSTYLGGSGADYGNGLALDSAGNIFVTGTTYSAGWLKGGFDTTLAGPSDAFVAKLSPAGGPLWSTCLGGAYDDYGRAIAVDKSGNAWITGTTWSPGWVSGGYDTSFGGDNGGGEAYPEGDAFAVKLSPAGQHLCSTYLGGLAADYGNAIAVDSAGNAYVTGETWSTGWVLGGFDSIYFDTFNNGIDSFVVKLSITGGRLWSTFLGKEGDDAGFAIAVDNEGNAFVTGITYSDRSFDSGGFDITYNGGSDAFVAKLSSAGKPLWSTYLGGSLDDYGSAITADGAGNVYVTGTTCSSSWAKNGFDASYNGGGDTFIARLSGQGVLLWSSYLGGNRDDSGNAVAADANGYVFVAGRMVSTGWASGGFDTGYNGGSADAFIAKIDDRIGSLRVTIAPPEVVKAGAQWRRAGTTPWLDSGFTETGVPSGNWNIEFKPITGWTRPLGVKATVLKDQIATVSGSYIRQTGSLYVTITPAEAMADGAKWRCVGTTTWRDSGTTETGIPTNPYMVEFKSLDGWIITSPIQIVIANNQVANVVGNYKRLGMAWSTYLGGSGYEYGNSIVVDNQENIYVTGSTHSPDWVSGGFDTSYNGNSDVFVTKLSPTGEHLWSTYLGGSSYDEASGIVLDSANNICLAGSTDSPGWVSGGFDTSYNGSTDVFVTKLSPTGKHLWSTYLGGDNSDVGCGIAVDTVGQIYITGTTRSGGWTSGGFDITNPDSTRTDGFVVKLSAEGAHIWSTYLGGNWFDEANAIAVDGMSNVCVTGTTEGGWVTGGYDTTFGGYYDAFVTKLSSSGELRWSTYLGGGYWGSWGNGFGWDSGEGITTDAAGNIYVTGATCCPDWVSGGFDTTFNGTPYVDSDAFACKLSPAGEHLWSTYLGGSNPDGGYGVVVDGGGNLYVAGGTKSAGWMTGVSDSTPYGLFDAYVAKLSTTGGILWSMYLGGNGDEFCNAIARGGEGEVYVTGWTQSSGWVAGGFDTSLWAIDAFVARIGDRAASLCVTLSPPEAVAAGARWRRVGTTTWFTSGATETGFPTGACTVEFSDLTGWIKPPNQTLTIEPNMTGQISGNYLAKQNAVGPENWTLY